ncbi:MAG: tripartite tricarboxylate transporter permease [Alphaproteobacteria bacterium]
MDIFSNLVLGLGVAFSPMNLLYALIGCVLGTAIGVLPGIGPLATVAMLLPITFTMEPVTSLIMIAGIYYGAQYGGSTTAILINLPGESSSVVTAIDGYQLARQGRSGAALGIAAIGSFAAGTIATCVIAILAVPLTAVALQFGAPEYFSLMVLGLILSVTLAHGSILKALGMILLGILLGLVGTDTNSGSLRYTLGSLELVDGFDLVASAVGMFGISEIIRNLASESTRDVHLTRTGSTLPTRDDLKASALPILRGTLFGSILGVLPGGGALLSSFASYAIEKRLAKDPSRFGRGAIEGVAGPEAANNAGAQTSFIPMLTLGLPSNGMMALIAGAMIIQGIVPGPNVMTDKPDLFWGLIASMWIGNAMLLVLNLPLLGVWVRLLSVPYHVLFPAVIVFSMIGVFSIANSPFHLYTLVFFSALGFVFYKLDCEPAPLLLGFILGPMLEQYFRRSMVLSRGDPTIFLTHPISLALLVVAVLMLVAIAVPGVARKRREVFVED